MSVANETARQPIDAPRHIVIDLDFDTSEHPQAFAASRPTSGSTRPTHPPEAAHTGLGAPHDRADLTRTGASRPTDSERKLLMSNQPDRPRPVNDDPALAWITIVDWPGGRLETFHLFDATH
jgi:hypothetical protein